MNHYEWDERWVNILLATSSWNYCRLQYNCTVFTTNRAQCNWFNGIYTTLKSQIFEFCLCWNEWAMCISCSSYQNQKHTSNFVHPTYFPVQSRFIQILILYMIITTLFKISNGIVIEFIRKTTLTFITLFSIFRIEKTFIDIINT